MWLLAEGYTRNPNMQTFLLSWGVPRWVGNASYFSPENIAYQVGYADCVRQTTSHTPDYQGIWNERSWGTVSYVVSLRAALDAAGLTTKLIIPDGGGCADVTAAAASNATFAASLYALGEHYPCQRACPRTVDVGLAFWASEDYSTVADWAGAGCWGRSLSQNWVRLNATSTISWSTVWSVYKNDIYYGNGLTYAYEPWSGSYEVNPSIWTTAHWTQFMTVGWHLLLTDAGRGLLPGGGSYVVARSPSGADFSLILESLEGACLRCAGGAVPAQDLVFTLRGGLPGPGTSLAVWQTTETALFVQLADAVVAADGSLSLHLPADAMLTVSTLRTARHGSFAVPIPASAPFPLPYADSFDNATYYAVDDRLPRFFGDQAGSFAVRRGVMQQTVPADPGPNGWVGNREPFTLLGDANWTDVSVQARVSFDGGPPDGMPAAEAAALAAAVRDDPAAGVAPCAAASPPPEQVWALNAVAPGYLSDAASPPLCLNVPGCTASAALIYYACVTTGCECGCPTFTNLQFALGADGALTTPLAPGSCVTLVATGALRLAPCTAGAGQVWAHNATTGQLSVTPPGGGAARCLAAPGPPPPPVPYAGLTVRAPSYQSGTLYPGYSFRAYADGTFAVLVGNAVLANGTLPATPPYNSSAWHTMGFAVRGNGLTASLDGATVWSGADAANTWPKGQVALSSGYHRAAFDDFAVAAA